MRLRFDRVGVDKLLAHARAARERAATYGQKPPIAPGLWLVGDQGIYLMSNGLPALMAEPAMPNATLRFVVYPRECDPTKMPFDRWYEVKRSAFGGDDGYEYIAATDVEAALKDQNATDPFTIQLTPGRLALMTLKRSAKAT